MAKIGIQMMVLRQQIMDNGVYSVLKKLHEIGFSCVEVSQVALQENFDKIVADCKTLNCNYLRVGMLPFHYIGSLEKSLAFAEKCDEMAIKIGGTWYFFLLSQPSH